MPEQNIIKIDELRCDFFYSIALAQLLPTHQDRLRSFSFFYNSGDRVIDRYLSEVPSKGLAFLPEYQADRGASNIIHTLSLDEKLKVFSWDVPFEFETPNLTITSNSFSFSKYATLGFDFLIKSKSSTSLGVEQLLEEMSEARQQIKMLIKDCILAAILKLKPFFFDALFSQCEIHDENINKWLKSFEVIDFDFRVGDLSGGEYLKNSFSSSSASPPIHPELIGFLRMTRLGVWENYKPDFIKEFLGNNIGNRKDELWIVHVKHFFRYHPERESKISVINFFNDVTTSIEILLHRVAYLEYLNFSMSHFMPTKIANWRKLISITEELTDECPLLPEYSDHDFFSKFIMRILNEFNYDALSNNYRALLEELRATTLSYTGLLSNKRVTQLTILIFILAVSQVFFLIFDITKKPIDNLLYYFSSSYWIANLSTIKNVLILLLIYLVMTSFLMKKIKRSKIFLKFRYLVSQKWHS